MAIQDEIEKALSTLKLSEYKVVNNSYMHKGHIGDDKSGESHFLIEVNKNLLAGNTILEKHKTLNSALSEIYKKTHSIEIKLLG